jgi:hypothetical protein
MTAAVPTPIKALRRSLRGAIEPGLRERLSGAIRRLERLYGLGESFEDEGDRRRRRFVSERHPFVCIRPGGKVYTNERP